MTIEVSRYGQFICADCGSNCGDPWYTGPLGHAPRNICLDCWVNQWEPSVRRRLNGEKFPPMEEALWLMAIGCSRSEAAKLIGVHRSTIHRWLRILRLKPELTPDWLLLAAV